MLRDISVGFSMEPYVKAKPQKVGKTKQKHAGNVKYSNLFLICYYLFRAWGIIHQFVIGREIRVYRTKG
jgi:hypothetical protein